MIIKISNQDVLIDDEDFDKVSQYNWYIAKHGYVRMTNRSKTYLHHLIIGKKSGLVVDHIDRNKLNNKKENLRHVTRAQNNANRESKGYYFCKERNKWTVNKRKNGKRFTKRFDTEEEAKRFVAKLEEKVS